MRGLVSILLAVVVMGSSANGGESADILPDVITNSAWLHDTVEVDDVEPGRRHLRLSNATPNIGPGILYIYGVLPAHEDGTQDVYQRLFQTGGGYRDVPAGRFVFHPTHDHVHLDDWAQYRLRTVLEGDGVGAVVAEGIKTSYCLRDSTIYNAQLPNFRFPGQFQDCGGTVQGISVGYEDVYTKNLPDQWIDITDLPSGEYWLESEVDPDNHIVEADETNNVARVKVTITGTSSSDEGGFWIRLIRRIIEWVLSLFGWLPGVPAPH